MKISKCVVAFLILVLATWAIAGDSSNYVQTTKEPDSLSVVTDSNLVLILEINIAEIGILQRTICTLAQILCMILYIKMLEKFGMTKRGK